MNIKQRLAIICLLLVVRGLAIGSPTPEASADHEISDLLNETGKSDLLEHLPLIMASSVGNQFRDYKQDLRVKIEAAIDDAFSPERVVPRVKRRIAANYNRKFVLECLTFTRSTVGTKFLAGERKLRNSDFVQKMALSLSSLQRSPITSTRLRLWTEFDQATKGVDMVIAYQVAIRRASTEMAEAGLRPELRTSETAMAALLSEEERKARLMLMENYASGQEYVFDDVSDAELEEYIRFMRTPAGRWYVDVYLAALLDAVVETFRLSGKDVLTAVGHVSH